MARNNAPYRRHGRWHFKKVAACLLIILCVYFVVSLLASAVAFRLIFHRSERVEPSMEQDYLDVDPVRYPRRALSFPSGRNTLQGYLYGAGNSRGVVIVAHGLFGDADSHLAETLFFVDHGWTVFCFDATGTRGSTGSGTVGLSQMKLDLLAAIRFLEAELPGQPLFLYGHSLGAYAAATVLNDCPEIRAAVCVAAFDSPVETMYYHSRLRVGILAATGYPFLRLWNYVLFGSEADESAAEAISQTQVPVLLIQGSEDRTVPYAISLYAHRDALRDPNVESILVEQPERNQHSTLWRTQEGAAYYLRMCQALDALRGGGTETPPKDAAEAFDAQSDRAILYALDPDFMDCVVDFFLRAA